jgi:hypothetical protein
MRTTNTLLSMIVVLLCFLYLRMSNSGLVATASASERVPLYGCHWVDERNCEYVPIRVDSKGVVYMTSRPTKLTEE